MDYAGSGIYAVGFNCGGVKIGQSINIKARMRAYKAPWCKDISYQLHIPIDIPDLSNIEQYAIGQLSRLAWERSASEEFFVTGDKTIVQDLFNEIASNYNQIKSQRAEIAALKADMLAVREAIADIQANDPPVTQAKIDDRLLNRKI